MLGSKRLSRNVRKDLLYLGEYVTLTSGLVLETENPEGTAIAIYIDILALAWCLLQLSSSKATRLELAHIRVEGSKLGEATYETPCDSA